jgi:hypothetical protein
MAGRRHAAQRWLRPDYFTGLLRLLWVFADLPLVGRIFLGKFFDYKSESRSVEHERLRLCRFEAKGTTGTAGDIASALASGKLQTADIGATDLITMRVVAGAVLGEDFMRVILLDPPGGNAKRRI